MFWIGGPDLDQLNKYAQTLKTALAKVPGTTDVDTNFIVGKPELGVRIDRDKAADLGVRVQDIAATLNVLVGGQKATSYYRRRRGVRGPRAGRGRATATTRRASSAMRCRRSPCGTVPLRDVVRLEEGNGAVADQPPRTGGGR